MASYQDFIDRINQLNDDFSWFHAKAGPATVAQIDDFEKDYGIRLPAEFKEFLTQLGTAIIEVNENI